jgi:alpha-galactosidase
VYSICEWGENKPWEWAADVGHLWRTTGDISDDWGSMVSILKQNLPLAPYAGPGHWNDPDMLEVGNGGMTKEEYKTHFSMWAMWSAPLLAGNDISNMSADTKEILLNKDVIAIDQDPLGQQARRVKRAGDLEVWVKQLNDGGRAVALVNRGKETAKATASWNEIGYPETLAATVRDLWTKKEEKSVKGAYSAEVPSHGVVMVRVEP